ncbi:hypothetical protein [Blastopirellula marina]|nr:hypothetical protein [Blastopirellula marina]
MSHMLTKFVLAAPLAVVAASPTLAQSCGPCSSGPSYKIIQQTVYDDQPVTVRRLEYRKVEIPREVTTYRPVWETEMRERRFTVAKPITETSEREERFRVMKPVWEEEIRDQSFNQVRYVEETEMRERRTTVLRPVCETTFVEQQVRVQRPVTETVMQTQTTVQYTPSTTLQTQMIQQNQVVNQTVYQPGPTRNRLRWTPGTSYVDPVTGRAMWDRAGLHWVPEQRPGTYQNVQTVVPTTIAQQVPVTTFLPQQVTQQIPVQRIRYDEEIQVQRIPMQTTRYESVEQVQQIPVTVRRPVVERVENKVPVKVCRWVEEEVVRKVPITTTRMVYEEKVEQTPVRVQKWVAETSTVYDSKLEPVWTEQQMVRRTPRTVTMRVPLDSMGNMIVTTPSPTITSYAPLSTVPSTVAPSVIVQKEPTEAKKPETAEEEEKEEAEESSESPMEDIDQGGPMAPLDDAKRPALTDEEPKDSDPTGTPSLDKAN